MIIAAGFPVLEPTFGLIFWTTLLFVLTWVILGKFAFKPIITAIRDREENISDSLKAAERARAEVAELKNENEDLLKKAKEERSKILREANEVKTQIIAEAREEAKKEAQKVIADAKHEIATEKAAAFADVKEEVGKIAVEIAEKLMKKDLAADQNQQQLISSLIDDANFNQN